MTKFFNFIKIAALLFMFVPQVCGSDFIVDPSFGVDGRTRILPAFGKLVVLSDGKILMSGTYLNSDNDLAISRFTADGTLDTTFNSTGFNTVSLGKYDSEGGLAVQEDGKIIVAGSADEYIGVARFHSDGSIDSTFNGKGYNVLRNDSTNLSEDSYITCIRIQADGKILVAGYCLEKSAAGVWSKGIITARFNADGTADTSFNGDGVVRTQVIDNLDDSTPRDLELQSDGKILLVGYALDNSGQDGRIIMVRYESDGTLDQSFNSSGKVVTNVSTRCWGAFASILNDGKIVVAARVDPTYSTSAYNTRNLILRYNTDGALDETFHGSGYVTLDASDSYEDFLYFDVSPSTGKMVLIDQGLNILHLNADASLDKSFNGTGKARVSEFNYPELNPENIYDVERVYFNTAFTNEGKLLLSAMVSVYYWKGMGSNYTYKEIVQTYQSTATATPKPAAPKVKISGPVTVKTTKSTVTINGTATGSVTSVMYRIGSVGAFKPVTGRNVWKFTASLKRGLNVISVIAKGPGGNSAPAKMTVNRK